MKKRILSLLLTLVMILGMIPATSLTAFAESGGVVSVGRVRMNDGDYLAVGATETQTTKPSGGYAYYNDGTLTLNNYSYEGTGLQYGSDMGYALYAIVYAECDLTVELVGTNTLTQTAETAVVIHVGDDADLTVDGNGKLIGTSDYYGLSVYGDITINGGTIAVTSKYSSIISAWGNVIINGGDIIAETTLTGYCINTSYDLTINGGNVTAISVDGHALGYDSVTIAKDLNIQASTTADGELGEPTLNICFYSKVVITGKPTIINVNGTISGVTGTTKTTVELYKSGSSTPMATTTVTGNGNFTFENVEAGSYTVKATAEGYITASKNFIITTGTAAVHPSLEMKPAIINNVNVSATFSGTPADATTSTTGATVTATKWYKKNGSSWTQLGASDTIKEGNTYRCEVTVGATSGYTLADGYTVKINGTAATKLSGNTWYVDRTITGYRDYVDITDIPLPEKGAKPDFNTYDIQSGYTNFGMIEWYKCDKDGKKIGDALTEDDVFEADSYYLLEVTVVPYENYLFDTTNLSFFINLKGVNYYYPHKDKYPNSVTGWKVYHVDDANGTYTVQIGDITLKDGDYLANNATAVTTVKPVGGYAYYKDGVLTLNNFVAAKLVRYYERYLEVELIGENKIGAIADYYYWDGNASNNYYTGLEFRGDGNLEFAGAYKPYSNISVNGDVIFNGSGDILFDAEICCFQYTENVIINDGYVYCYTSQDSVFIGNTIIEVNGGKLKMLDGGSWNDFTCNGTLTIAAGSVYVSADSTKTELADCVPWDGVTDLNTYDCVWVVDEQATVTHTVTFKVDTTTVATKTVEDGKTVTAPADPTQSGKTFLGWYTDGGTKFDFTTPITGDITLTAKFEDATSTVKLGDVNLDGNVDYLDLQRLYQHLSTSNALTGEALAVANVNGDTTVDYFDLQRLYQHLSTDNKLF